MNYEQLELDIRATLKTAIPNATSLLLYDVTRELMSHVFKADASQPNQQEPKAS